MGAAEYKICDTTEKVPSGLHRTFSDLGRCFSDSADKLADICIDKREEGKSQKAKKEIIGLFTTMVSHIKKTGKTPEDTKKYRQSTWKRSYGLDQMDNALFLRLGQKFYAWNRANRLKFVFGAEGGNTRNEIIRLLKEIENAEDGKTI